MVVVDDELEVGTGLPTNIHRDKMLGGCERRRRRKRR